jgi:hypothetical protein
MAEDDAQLAPDQAVARVGMQVAARAEGQRCVVHVQAHEPVEPDPLVELAHELVHARRIADVDARRPQVARVEADADPPRAAELVEHPRDVVDGEAHRVPGTGGVLDDEPGPRPLVALAERDLKRRDHLVEGCVEAASQVASEVEDDAVGLVGLCGEHRPPQRLDALRVDAVVGGAEVDEIRGVAGDGADAVRLTRRAEALGGVGIDIRVPPHPRALREDLERVRPDHAGALGGLVGSAGGLQVRAEFHRPIVSGRASALR